MENIKEETNMATWAKEIMKLANDFCLNTNKVKEIVSSVDELSIPQGKNAEEWKYDKARLRILPLIMSI
jgi:hypothetical protein